MSEKATPKISWAKVQRWLKAAVDWLKPRSGWLKIAVPRSDFWIFSILAVSWLLFPTIRKRPWLTALGFPVFLLLFYSFYCIGGIAFIIEQLRSSFTTNRGIKDANFVINHRYKVVSLLMLGVFIWIVFGRSWSAFTEETALLGNYHSKIMRTPDVPSLQVYVDYPVIIKRSDDGLIRIGAHNPATNTKILQAEIHANDVNGLLQFTGEATSKNSVVFNELTPGTTRYDSLTYTASPGLDHTAIQPLTLSLWVEYVVLSPTLSITTSSITTFTPYTIPIRRITPITPSIAVYKYTDQLERWENVTGTLTQTLTSIAGSVDQFGAAIATLLASMIALRDQWKRILPGKKPD